MRDVSVWQTAVLYEYDAPGTDGYMSKEAVMKSAHLVKQVVCCMPGVLVQAQLKVKLKRYTTFHGLLVEPYGPISTEIDSVELYLLLEQYLLS